MQWYYAINGNKLGPISQIEFERLVRMNVITAETFVWKPGMPQWQKLSELLAAEPDIIAAAKPPPIPENLPPPIPILPPITALFEQGEIIRAPMFNYAGFWVRVVARILDGFILYAINLVTLNILSLLGILSIPEPFNPAVTLSPMELWLSFSQYLSQHTHYLMISSLIALLIALVYECVFIRKYSATPGKIVMGLRLVRSDGARLSVGRIIGRHFADLLNNLAFGLTYLLVAVDEEKRGIHDSICDTRVIKK